MQRASDRMVAALKEEWRLLRDPLRVAIVIAVLVVINIVMRPHPATPMTVPEADVARAMKGDI